MPPFVAYSVKYSMHRFSQQSNNLVGNRRGGLMRLIVLAFIIAPYSRVHTLSDMLC